MMHIGGSSRVAAGEPPEVIRAEIFSAERLEQHAASLAAAERVTARPVAAPPLITRLRDNRRALLKAHRTIASAIAQGHAITPSAEWLVDNYHVVEAVRADEARHRDVNPDFADRLDAGGSRVNACGWRG